MGRSLWFDPGFGASGDMMLGALIGLGAPVEEVRAALETLDVDGWTLDAETVMRCSLASDRALVHSDEGHHHRTWSSIDAMLAASDLPDQARAGSRATFRRLGEVEAGIHNVTIDEVHFHEVGAVDAIVDIVGSWVALGLLDVEQVVCGPVGMGHGTTVAAHGRLPIPAPATAALLIGAELTPIDVEAETVTPTGAALLMSMATSFGPLPTGTMAGLARGAGGRDPEHYPNVLTAILLEDGQTTGSTGAAATTAAEPGAPEVQTTAVLTTNVDDLTPELVAHTIDRCLAEGAADAWATPIVMKKGRPAVELHVMCPPGDVERLRDLLYAETGTLGIRATTVDKHVLPRRFDHVTVRGHRIKVKVGPFGAKPEYEDLVSAGQALAMPVRTLWFEALERHRSDNPER